MIEAVLTWRLFARPTEAAGFRDILTWWERRRIPYNAMVGTAGVIACVIILGVAVIASEAFNEPLGLPDPPILAVLGLVLFAIGANICYTGGWMVEWLVRNIWRERAGAFGVISFCLGTAFSILLTLLPAVGLAGILIVRLLLPVFGLL